MTSPPETLTTSSARPRRPQTWPLTATLIATSLGFGVIQLDVTVVNVAVKQIGASFGGGITGLQWVVSAYTLVLAALILTAGALGDRFGAKRMLCTGFVVFTAASVLCGLSTSMAMLIAARAVQGLGAALLGSCALALLNHSYTDPRQRTRAVGQFVAGASAALSGGPVIGGFLIAAFGWRAIFFINVPLGAAGFWLALRYASETDRSARRRVDTRGAALATIALAGFAAAVIEAGTYGFTSRWVLAGLGCSLAAAVAFVAAEQRTASPMLPLSLFRRPGFVSPVTMGFLVNVCFYGLIFLFSLLFQAQHHMSALQTGLAFLPMTAAILGANLISGRVNAAIGPQSRHPGRPGRDDRRVRRAAVDQPGHRLPGHARPADPARRRAGDARAADDERAAGQRRPQPLGRHLRRPDRLPAGRQPARRRPVRLARRDRFLRRLPHRPRDLRRHPDRQRGRGGRRGRDRTAGRGLMIQPSAS